MSNNPRGRAVIINNKYFYDEEHHRHGTDHDKEKLQELFRKLYFDTITHDNLTAEQIRETLKEESRKQESSANAFVLCILSHGENDHILGTDEEMISIDDITAMFDGKSCPTLINKPKIFIFQACRGKAKTSGVTLEQTDLDETDFEDKMKQMNIRDSTDAEPIPKRHEKADMIKAFATVPDYVSWRHKLEGSWFINDLVDTFAECACNDDILSLLGEVTKRVATRKTSTGEYIGLTQMHVQLLKKLYFFPGYSKPSQNHTHKRSDSIQATD
ncbi:Cell death protein 3 [Lamellibrachia satsuma]|nr:Cell death protein 3 [Lamellibrachia satsuma]